MRRLYGSHSGENLAEEVSSDPTRPDQQSRLQLQANLNIPHPEPDDQSDDINNTPIPASIRVFSPPGLSRDNTCPLARRKVYIVPSSP
jgi:hypothetical protein